MQRVRREWSLSSWRAWIEIRRARASHGDTRRRSPHGERGLKFDMSEVNPDGGGGRSPHGERGLKSGAHWHHSTLQRVALLMESVD